MNKSYFTKWLPEDGEKKTANYLLYKGLAYRHTPILNNKDDKIYTFITNMYEKGGYHEKWEDVTPCKLFLCSRDVKVGDEVIKLAGTVDEGKGTIVQLGETVVRLKLNDLDENNEPIIAGYQMKSIIKVIGEKSPEATWVKEGDEFDESEIEAWWWDVNRGWFRYRYEADDELREYIRIVNKRGDISKIFKLKGPCGHFH